VLDSVNGTNHLGSKLLLEKACQIKPKYHIFGHIHDSYGKYADKINGITFINISLLDERYDFVNKPIILDL
jgi:Icc-related predicted phosphoesterase